MFDPVSIFRVSRWFFRHKVPLLPRFVDRFNQGVFHFYLPHYTDVGRDLRVGQDGFGIVVNPKARIGNSVYISPGVTIGGRNESDVLPIIEDHVFIGAGAKVLGGITLGAGSKIGANAVVLHSVPPGCVAAGVPAKVIRTADGKRAEVSTRVQA
jgi:serine O-acetyltransferase